LASLDEIEVAHLENLEGQHSIWKYAV
jgi:hypothetical protein